MATLTVADISRDGVAATLVAAAAGGDEFANTGREFLTVTNGGGGSITVTFVTTYSYDGLAVADKTVTVNAGATLHIGPFSTGLYNNTTTNRVAVTYSGVTSVTVGAFRLTPAT